MCFMFRAAEKKHLIQKKAKTDINTESKSKLENFLKP